jgi:hypothetical protein
MAAGDQHTSYLLSRRPGILQVDTHEYVLAEEEINTLSGNRLIILAVGRDMDYPRTGRVTIFWESPMIPA